LKPTPFQLDALKELINIGIGRAASILSTMTSEPVQLTVPEIFHLPVDQIPTALARIDGETLADVRQCFSGSLVGSADLLFPPESAATLVNAVTGDMNDDTDLDEVRVETLSEIGNIVINGVMGTIANILDRDVAYAIPTFREDTLESMFLPASLVEARSCVLVNARFSIKSIEISGDILLIFDVESQVSLWNAIDRMVESNS
jgi:chemotaxis protein CheC